MLSGSLGLRVGEEVEVGVAPSLSRWVSGWVVVLAASGVCYFKRGRMEMVEGGLG